MILLRSGTGATVARWARTGRLPGDAYLALGAVAATCAAAAPSASVDDGPVVCPFRLVTGLPCPACGSTRAWVQLLDGHVATALHLNPFAVVLLVGLLVALVARAFGVRVTAPDLRRPWIAAPVALFAASWAVWAVVRMVEVSGLLA